ncbi:MAG: polysaccharide biosynthesis tyrosine autokinase [Neorhizobium sp.]|nr:polysaccharide biosynthesis tyrosine autokinase [Neorhizobium sp.]
MNPRPMIIANHEDTGPVAEAPRLDLDRLLAASRRQWRFVLVTTVVFVGLGLCYLLVAVPKYTAHTSVMIDRSNSQVVEQLSTIGGVLDDESSVLSQVELLKSETIGLAVIDKLALADNVEFMGGAATLLGDTVSWLKSTVDPRRWFGDDADDLLDPVAVKRRLALGRLESATTIARVGRSYVLDISVTSTSPQLAAAIASSLADGYLTDKLDAKYDATKRAGEWLQQRIEELRQRSLESDLAVQKFRAANGLVVANDQLVSDQQLTELNSGLIVARADTARATAKYERIRSIIDSGRTDAIVADALDSSVINSMREKYLDASKREADISKRLGEGHIQAIRLRQEMAEYTRLMFDELGRIAESYQSELDVARSREKQILLGVENATKVSVAASETQVQLRELERSAETYKNLYQTFLQRYQEAVQQQSFPITEARIITRAVAPNDPSEPKKALVLAACLLLGGLAGSAGAAYREFRDRFFRTGEQVRDVLDLEYLGSVPRIDDREAKDADVEPSPGVIHSRNALSRFATEHPLSSFAETMRSARIAADLHVVKPHKVLGVVSVLPGEGKSTVAVNLAQTLAMSARTLLIDADLRNPGATRALAQHAEAGLLEVLIEGRSAASVMLSAEGSGLKFIPAVVKRRVPHSSELLASPQMMKLLAEVGSEFDYIILDLPPLGPVVDARAIAGKMDGFVMVVEWGATSRRVVRDTLAAEPQIANRCVGVVLNKVDTDKMKLYREYGSSDYYVSRYTAYYRDDA